MAQSRQPIGQPSGASLMGLFLVALMMPESGAEDFVTTQNTGRSGNRVDVVFLGDGYQQDELPLYNQHIDGMLDHMFGEAPFNRYQNFFNVHRTEVISAESGADEPPNDIFVDTALDAKYWFNGTTERLLYISDSRANAVVSRTYTQETGIDVNMRYVAINAEKYGGGGGRYATFAGGNELAFELALHEQGHSFSDLADEYVSFDGPYTGREPRHANATLDPNGTKWEHWLGYEEEGIGVIGAYEGALYYPEGVYRPSPDSKMRSLGQPFDAVSREQLVRDIYRFVSPLDWSTDNSRLLTLRDDSVSSVSVQTIDPEVITLEWFVNGVPIANSNTPTFEISWLTEMELPLGNYEISVVAEDLTDWVRVDRDRLQQSVSWNVDYSAIPEPTGLFSIMIAAFLMLPLRRITRRNETHLHRR